MSNLLIKIANWLSGGLITELTGRLGIWKRLNDLNQAEWVFLLSRHNQMKNSVTQACVELPNVRDYVSRLELENDVMKKELNTRRVNDEIFERRLIQSSVLVHQLRNEKARVERLWEETHVWLAESIERANSFELMLATSEEQTAEALTNFQAADIRADGYEALLSNSENITQRALEQLQKAHADNQALLLKIKKLETRETFGYQGFPFKDGTIW